MWRSQVDRNVPNLDLAWYVQDRDYEHYFYEFNTEIIGGTQASFRDVERRTMRQWPEPLSPHMPVDRTDRYAGSIEGWFLEVDVRDELTGMCYPMPRCPHVWLDPTYEVPEINPQEVVTKPLKHHNPAEAATRNPNGVPLPWARLPFKNETEAQDSRFRGYTHLKEPILVDMHGYEGSSIVLRNPNDTLLFTPFDFSHPEWYNCFADDGTPLDSYHWLALRPDANYTIHLRPRWWRYTIFVLAHYAYVSLWGLQLNDEYFTHVFFDRPPVYPYRHDVIHTKQVQGTPNWNNDMRSYDLGLDMWWETTKAAGNLAREILDQQYSWYCVVYMFLSNENPDCFIECWPPYKGDIVCAIEREDKATGSTTTVFVQQNRSLSTVFPKYQFGAFLFNWLVVPEPARWKPGKG